MTDQTGADPQATRLGAAQVLIDPNIVAAPDDSALSDSVFDAITTMLANRGIEYDFSPDADKEVNEAYTDAMEALHESVVETMAHTMYLRQWALGVLAQLFHSGDMLAIFESGDPQEFGERVGRAAARLTRAAASAVAMCSAAMVVLPDDEEYMDKENALRRLVTFDVEFLDAEVTDFTGFSVGAYAPDAVTPMTDEEWEEYLYGSEVEDDTDE